MNTMEIMKKLSKIYVKGLVRQDEMYQFTIICMDILRELEVARLKNEESITLEVNGKEHKALLTLLEDTNADDK